jgi:poly [ADP-ribose] polymerase 6/8
MFKRKVSSSVEGGGQLQILVVEARNLAAKDKDGYSDPYVVLMWDKEKQQTRVVRKSLNPAWGEHFQFATTNPDADLRIAVWDKDLLWSDFLGTVTIPASSFKGKRSHDQWYPLGPRSGKRKEIVSGDIRLIITSVTPGDKDSDSDTNSPVSAPDSARSTSDKEEGESPNDEMALVNSYLHASQNKSQPVKQSKKADAKAKNKDKPKRVLKRSEQTTEAVVQELQKLYQNSPDSCVKKIKWDRDNKTVSVQLSNVDNGTVNLSIFLADDASPVTMLEGVSGHVDESKAERLVGQANDYAGDHPALADIVNFITSRFDRSLNKSQFMAAIRASQLAPKEKGKEKADDDLHKSKLGLSQALGKAWRTASAVVPADGEDEDDYDDYDDSDYASDDDYDWDTPVEDTLLEKHIKQLQVVFGSECASAWGDLGVVRLFIDTHFFEENAANAMGVDRELPITIIITFGEGYLENDVVPKVEVKQVKNPRFALEFQLTQIAQKFLKDNWPKRRMGISLPSINQKQEKAKMKLRTNDVGNLVKQGYNQLAAANALEISGNDFAKAVKLLNSQGGDIDIVELSSSKEAKHNFLGWMMTYMLGRMRNCTSYCLICDVKLEGSGVKPVVCSNDDCVWRYEELGLGVKVTNELLLDDDVVDLLMSMLYSACSSDRKNLICDPFPRDFITETVKRHDEVQNCINCLEGIHELMEFKTDERALRVFLEKKDPLLYRLIRWVLSSNRAFIKKIDPDMHLSQMQTPHQYLLLSSPPEKKAKFDAYRLEFGSFFAFHGSALENWHAIMRKGLRNLSNTEFMTTGAAYGAGIYLSPHASTSKGYARFGRGWDKSRFGSVNVTCMAICEIIDHPSLAGMPNPHYVVQNEDLVSTLVFCFYTDKEPIPDSVDLVSLKDALYELQGYKPTKEYPTKNYTDGY